MPIAISTGERHPFVLERERAEAEDDTKPKEGGAIFHIKPPTYRLRMRLMDKATAIETEGGYVSRMPMGSAFVEAARDCLVGWDGVLDSKGDPVPFRGHNGGASEADLSLLSFADIQEIGERAWRLGELTEEDRGK
jgi:hypothetical protein